MVESFAPLVQAIENISQGRQLDPSQDKISAVDPRYEPSIDPANKGDVQALPFGDLGDPVSFLAMMAAPYLKAFLGRASNVVPSIPGKSLLQSQRGSSGTPPNETSFEALKRMFFERGGVESGEGISIPSRMTYKESAAYMKGLINKPKTNLSLNDLTKVPEYQTFISKALSRHSESDIATALNSNYELQQLLKETYRLNTTITKSKDIDQLLSFIKTNVNKNTDTLKNAIDLGYIEPINDGYWLGSRASDRALQRYLNLNDLSY